MGARFRELKNMAGGLMLCRKCQAGFSHPHLTAPAQGWKRLRHQLAPPRCAMPQGKAENRSNHNGWKRPGLGCALPSNGSTRTLTVPKSLSLRKPHHIALLAASPSPRGCSRFAKPSQNPSSYTPAGLIPSPPPPGMQLHWRSPQEGVGAKQRGLGSPNPGGLAGLGSSYSRVLLGQDSQQQSPLNQPTTITPGQDQAGNPWEGDRGLDPKTGFHHSPRCSQREGAPHLTAAHTCPCAGTRRAALAGYGPPCTWGGGGSAAPWRARA